MTGGQQYDAVAVEAAALVIRRYSTSFGLAARLLSPPVRRDVRSIYALVRIADEIVDGAASDAGLDDASTTRTLDDLEADTERAIAIGYSANLVVHAFALTARRAGIDASLTRPFFASMRADITDVEHTPESFDAYVYGSAEVVGLMCLRVFLAGERRSAAQTARLEEGARRLGAAFQKVNFLRDLAADFAGLGRSYFPGISVDAFSEADKTRLLDDIDADLAASAATIDGLPASSRRAVVLAHDLFAELSRRIRSTPASELVTTRVRVPNPVKMRIAVNAARGVRPR
ncbi:phytoene/squalene synthase family protein [Labedella populi]|uniref:Phytoene/squalene synthase family protein n=1 Tax=Labedella populi TaxID=2498850 RepID=A0A444QF61_9MICO|nr:phytoene/squalene synthase family protein [Labedella populi]